MSSHDMKASNPRRIVVIDDNPDIHNDFATILAVKADLSRLESLESNNPDIHYEAVCAAGNWEVEAAWSHIVRLIKSEDTDKFLLLAAIEAAASIHPRKAPGILFDLTESDDEDIAEAAYEASAMAEGLAGLDWDEDRDKDSLC